MPDSEQGPASEELTLAAVPPDREAPRDDATLVAAGVDPATPGLRIGVSRAGRVIRLLRGDAGPTRLGHYVILDKLGEGGMGVVFAAYDEKLDRKVAIKLLRAEGPSEAQLRLVREAQAMARLSHPNVTQIYEIGELEGGEELTFIVMEFIDGVTLGAWRRQQPRTQAELLAVFTAAGRGLAAAHDKGLVHRDFKPDNVMLRRDGRVVVMDFGLAREGVGLGSRADRPAIAASDDPSSGQSISGSTRELSIDLTTTGALMGTPAYMAPEQFKGEATDAKTDQFSFCVALWEALYGQRPFSAPTLAGLSLAVTRGERQIPANVEVPSWLVRVLERGLAIEPSERWPSMDALLDALANDPTDRARRRRRGLLAGFAALTVVVGAIVGARVLEARAEARTLATCEREGQQIAAIWNQQIREQLAVRFAEAGAEHAWTHANAWMDGYARDWTELRERSCVEARVTHARDETDHLRVAACLDEGRSAAEALVEVWRSSEDRIVIQAAAAAAGLPPVDLCDNEAWLAHRVSPPRDGAAREQVATLRAQLQRVEALSLVGEYEAGLRDAEAVLERAQALGWAPLEVEARLAVGRLQVELGRYQDARANLEQASLDATAAAHDLVTLGAAISLASLVGYQLSEHAAGDYWGRLGSKLIERMHLEGTVHEAALRSSIGDAEWAAGNYPASLAAYRQAHALYLQALGPEHPEVAYELNNIGYLHKEQGDYAEALSFYQRALELIEAALGPEHPKVGEALTFIGDGLRHTGEPRAALAIHRRAVEVFEAALGPNHPQVADALNNLGNTLSSLDHDDEALAVYQRALAINEAVYGADDVAIATSLNNIALCHVRRQEYQQAQVIFRRALELWIANHGPEHPYVAVCYANIGGALVEEGKYREAIVELERAKQIFTTALGPEHPNVARSLTKIGKAHASLGELDEASAALETAVRLLEHGSGDIGLPEARFELARVLAQTGQIERARAAAAQARTELVQRGAAVQLLEQLDAWLASLGEPR